MGEGLQQVVLDCEGTVSNNEVWHLLSVPRKVGEGVWWWAADSVLFKDVEELCLLENHTVWHAPFPPRASQMNL